MRTGQAVESCTILTTGPNETMEPIHNRMPVILAPDDYERWLDPKVRDAKELQPLLRPYPAQKMVAQPISSRVNKPKNEGPGCIEPA
jgi:putative SOS response-associated peptidase YedK